VDFQLTRTRLLAVVTKEVRQTMRDRRMIVMLLVAPFIQLVIFANAINFEVDRVPAVVVDRDRSPESRAHAAALLADGTLTRVADTEGEAEAEGMLEDGTARAAVLLPEGLGQDLVRGSGAHVQVLLDGTDPTRANVAGGAVNRYFLQVALDMTGQRLALLDAARGTVTRIPRVRLVPRVYYNPRLKTAVYMVPGIAAMLLLMVSTIITSMGLAREREMGTLEQVLVTPIPPSVLMVGKVLPFVVVGLIDLGLALAVGSWVFDVPLRGSLLFLLVATAAYLMSALGIGLFISTVSGSQQQAFMGGFLFMLPAILLSGNMTPISSMPDWLQPVTYLNPLRYYIEIVRANLLKGAGADDLWPQLAALTTMGVVIITIASARFRKTMG